MAALLPLSDQGSIQQQLLEMGFAPTHIQAAIAQFKQNHGEDYNINIIVELAINIKNAQNQITEQRSNYNKQEIGNELYFKIHCMEPILAGKITGMMLQWDINQLLSVLHDTRALQRIINQAKAALEHVPFQAHMDLLSAHNLRLNDKVDFRDIFGKYVHSTVLQKNGTLLLIQPVVHNPFDRETDTMLCDYTKQLHRFAVSGAISARPRHRLRHLKCGDMVDFNPNIGATPSWTSGRIINTDGNSGQIEIMYECEVNTGISCMSDRARWTHVDNVEEIAVFRTKYEYVDISVDLLRWKSLAISQINRLSKINRFLLLNDDEMIAVSDYKILKYFIRSNTWSVWITFDFEITCCCLNHDKSTLYILNPAIPYLQRIGGKQRNIRITEVNISTLEVVTFAVKFPCIPQSMLIVENTLHLFGQMMVFEGLHFIWEKGWNSAQLVHTLKSDMNDMRRSICGRHNAFIHCFERNVLLLFGNMFGSTLYVYSLKKNRWYRQSLSVNLNCTVRNSPLWEKFGYAITNDEKYILIFPGGLNTVFMVGTICLIDIEKSKLTISKTYNVLLKKVAESMNSCGGIRFDDDQLFWPVIVNKTTILIDGFLRECWTNDAFCDVRLLSDDVVAMIKGWNGYDNDELYIYCVYGGFLWNTKVNEIIKHELPKLKFCCDINVFNQERLRLMITKNTLLKQHNNLVAKSQLHHKQQAQYFAFYPATSRPY